MKEGLVCIVVHTFCLTTHRDENRTGFGPRLLGFQEGEKLISQCGRVCVLYVKFDVSKSETIIELTEGH